MKKTGESLPQARRSPRGRLQRSRGSGGEPVTIAAHSVDVAVPHQGPSAAWPAPAGRPRGAGHQLRTTHATPSQGLGASRETTRRAAKILAGTDGSKQRLAVIEIRDPSAQRVAAVGSAGAMTQVTEGKPAHA
jgi:hypothetical protein